MAFKKKKEKVEVDATKYVVQIREMLDNKKFANSVTKIVGSKVGKDIYKLLEE